MKNKKRNNSGVMSNRSIWRNEKLKYEIKMEKKEKE